MYASSKPEQIDYWVDQLNDFLERKLIRFDDLFMEISLESSIIILPAYRNSSALPGGGTNQKICDFDNLPRDDQVCAVVMDDFKDCSPDNGYSYAKSSPCIFLKLNRVSSNIKFL